MAEGRNLYARLVAYEAHGDRIGILPQPTSWQALVEFDETGSLTLDYSALAVGGDVSTRALHEGTEIAVEVSDGGAWTEPPSMRYLVVKREGDQTDTTGTITFTCVSYGWLLNKILNLNTSALQTDGDNKGKRPFLSATAGTIVKTYMDENSSRGGAASCITTSFDTGKDTGGAAWAREDTLYYSLGVSLKTCLDSMVQGAMCDWDTMGRTLRMWNADSATRSRDLSGSVVIQLARDLSDAPFEETIEDLSSHILVTGDNDLVFTQDNNAAPTPWGKWESYVSQGGVSDEGTAKAFMQTTLEQSSRMRGSYTESLVVSDATWLPLIDYQPGDWVTAPTINHGEKVRVRQIKLNLDNTDGAPRITCSVTVNDALTDPYTRNAKKTNGITGGAALAGSESSRPSAGNDHRVPKAVQGVVASSDAYVDETGQSFGLASVRWAEVTQATDNTAIDIARYEVQYQRSTDQTDYWNAAGTTTSLSISFGHLDCGATIRIRVRAIPQYSDRPGEWSGVVELVIASDTTPPSVPSKPVLSSSLGVVEVRSDGLTANGGRFEPDTAYLEVGRSESNGNWVAVGKLAPGSVMDDIGLTLNKTYWYALRAVDYSGNQSAWSAGASVAVAPAVTQDELNDLAERVTNGEEVAEDLKTQQDKITGDLQQANQTLDQARKDIASNQQTIQQTNQTVSQVQSDLTGTKNDLNGVKNDLSDTNKDLEQAKTDLSQVRKDLSTANTELDNVGRTASDAASKAQQAIQNAATAQTTADGKNRIFHDWQDPRTTDPDVKLNVGDEWYRYQRYWTTALGEPDNSPSALADFYTYADGEPDNSPSVLVTLDSEIQEVLVWDGSNWNDKTFVANDVIVSGTITGDLIAANTIVGDKIAAGAITSEKIVSLAVTADKLAANAVTAEKIAANSVTTGKIVANAVTADKIAANAVSAGKIAAGAVTTDKLAANAVTAAKIAALTITGDKLAANAISADKITSNAVTSAKIAAGAVTADKLSANAVTAGKIAAGAIDGMTITGAILQTSGTANRGVKVTSGGLSAYDGSGNAKTVISASTGQITTDGAVISNGGLTAPTITGGVITGSVVRSSASSYPRFELSSTALDMWDSSKNRTVHLDGAGASNLLTGTFQTALSGRRVRISPDFSMYEIDNPSVTSTGPGIQLFLDGTAATHPYIAAESSVSDEGQVSNVVINGGYRAVGDPGAFLRVGERGASGSRYATAYLGAFQDYADGSSSPYSYLRIQAPKGSGPTALLRANNGSKFTGCYLNGDGGYSYLYAGDDNGYVGVQADIDAGFLYMGGYLGQLTGRGTFLAVNWRMYQNATIGLQATLNQVTWTFPTPAKYGHYHGVVSSDVNWGSIFLHVCNTGSASTMQVMGFNAGSTGSAYTGDVWANAFAWLEK